MQINTNPSALNTMRQLDSSQRTLERSLERLSSGLRVNSARDDAAGMAIAERMTTQMRGLSQAARNANDGISLLQTADGAMSTVSDNLQRIRELAVQAANSTNSNSDKVALQAEVSQRIAEIERVSKQTTFNGVAVFSQLDASVVGDENQLAVLDGLKGGWLEQSENLIQQYYGLTSDGAAMSIELTSFTDGAGGVAAQVVSSLSTNPGFGGNLKLQIDMADFTPPNLPNGGSAPFYNDRIIAHEMVHAVMARTMNWADIVINHKWFAEGAAEFIHGADERLNSDVISAGSVQGVVDALDNGFQLTSADYSAAYGAVRFLHSQIKAAGGEGIKEVMDYLSANQTATLDNAFQNAVSTLGGLVAGYTSVANFLSDYDGGAGATYLSGLDLANGDTGAIGGFDADASVIRTADSVVADTGTKSGTDVLDGFAESFENIAVATTNNQKRTLQIGANIHETLDIELGALRTGALDIEDVDVVNFASQALAKIDRALDYASGERAKIGAQQNRLESTIANIENSALNVTASRSRVVDADYAAEMAELTRSQILQQAGAAVLAQANTMPRMVLALLR